jgi:hypothetical protein
VQFNKHSRGQAFCSASITPPRADTIRTRMNLVRKKSGAQVGAPDKSNQLSTAGGPSQGEVPGREHGYRRSLPP